MEIPKPVHQIMIALKKEGFESYAVGGCVRDSLLGLTPKDWDLCTSASVNEIRSALWAFSQVPIGLKHGTILVLADDQPVDVSTFHANKNLLVDLSFRDFTINAIACDEKGKIFDPFNGQGDLDNRIIKCVGEATDRFQEDPLRILRALRFAATLEFSLDKTTKATMTACRHLLSKVSAERICHELSLFITYTDFDLLYNAREILSIVIEDLGSTEDSKRIEPLAVPWTQVSKSVTLAPNDTEIRLALLLRYFDNSQEFAKKIKKTLKKLRFSNSTIDNVCLLIEHSYTNLKPFPRDIKLILNKIEREHFERLLFVQEAIQESALLDNKDERFPSLPMVKKIFNEIIRENQCYSLRDLAVNGDHLTSAGFAAGKALGDLLNVLLMEVIEEKTTNDKEILIKRAQEIKTSQLLHSCRKIIKGN